MLPFSDSLLSSTLVLIGRSSGAARSPPSAAGVCGSGCPRGEDSQKGVNRDTGGWEARGSRDMHGRFGSIHDLFINNQHKPSKRSCNQKVWIWRVVLVYDSWSRCLMSWWDLNWNWLITKTTCSFFLNTKLHVVVLDRCKQLQPAEFDPLMGAMDLEDSRWYLYKDLS